MKKKRVDLPRSQEGQVLIIVALVFTGLVVLAGLAIDGGNLFTQRRQAQNASDAAALAGTRLLAQAIQSCAPIDEAAVDAAIHCTINDYAEQNGISDTNEFKGDEVNDNVVGTYVDTNGAFLGQVGAGALPWGTAGVRVAVEDTDETFFLPVIGIPEIPSSAQATALTGPVVQLPAGAPLLPIAVPKVVTDELDPDQEWEMLDNKDGKFCYTDSNGDQQCIVDLDAPYNAQRGWLNLNHNFNNLYLGSTNPMNRTFEKLLSNAGCPKDPNFPPLSGSDLPGLPGYASGECPYGFNIIAGTPGGWDGDFIHGTTGARANDVRAIYEAFANFGGEAYAPVFDVAYMSEEMVAQFGAGAASPEGFPNGGGFATAGGGGAAYYFHIVGWVEIKGDPSDKNNHVVYGEFQTAVVRGGIIGQGYDGSGTCSPTLFGINLWE